MVPLFLVVAVFLGGQRGPADVPSLPSALRPSARHNFEGFREPSPPCFVGNLSRPYFWPSRMCLRLLPERVAQPPTPSVELCSIKLHRFSAAGTGRTSV